MTLAVDQLRNDTDDERIGWQVERREQSSARRNVGPVTLRVDGARNELGCDPGGAELPHDRARQRDHGSIRPVFDAREQGRLGGVDAPREHGRDAGERRGEAAVEIEARISASF